MTRPSFTPILAPEVTDAIAAGRPVVALESTIVTHGMPHPTNVETARAVEADVRTGGAVPATIAVMDGRLRVGLTPDELDALAGARDVWKLSRADLAAAMATGATGSTTVAATMIAARAAGIHIFATGGIGGVHRGAAETFDVSADLEELARTPVIVVCAGAKAVLDLPLTLEALETRGVPVIGYGTNALPAFWARDSGLPAPLRLDDPSAIARAHLIRASLGIGGGALVCNPVPEDAAVPRDTVDGWIADALAHAERTGARGKDVTPVLLARIAKISGGASLAANVALIRSNATLAARIAVALAEMRDGG